MSRIFSARINIDDLSASLALCLTDQERAAWSQGLIYGLSGGPRREGMPTAFDSAWTVGMAAHAAARRHQEMSGKGGRTTMERHPDANIAKRVSSDVPSDVRPDVPSDHPSEQSNNRIIEESREPQNQQTRTIEGSATPPRRGRAKLTPVIDGPPSLADVEAYVSEIDGRIPADEFIDSNARAGWTYGKGRPVLDWKAHYRTWNRSRQQGAQPPQADGPDPEAIEFLRAEYRKCKERGEAQ